MSNFDFIKQNPEYAVLAKPAITAEEMLIDYPDLCAFSCRKALEFGVQWVYTVEKVYFSSHDKLMSLIHNWPIKNADTMMNAMWPEIKDLVYLGNDSAHEKDAISQKQALVALNTLFDFLKWIDWKYGKHTKGYTPPVFDTKKIKKSYSPAAANKLKHKAMTLIKERDALLEQYKAEMEGKDQKIKDQNKALDEAKALLEKLQAEREALLEEVRRQAEEIAKRKSKNLPPPQPKTEYETRKQLIDLDLIYMGWNLDDTTQVREEYMVDNMAGVPGAKGYADYVLFGKDGLPLAVIEAKSVTKDPTSGETQALHYADALQKKFGRRPMIFTTNGYQTWFWDDMTGPKRQVSRLFSRSDLEKLILRREQRHDLATLEINREITGRYYQMEAIRAVCDATQKGVRKHLLVMATGTGKTRTAASLVDVLTRGGYATNILFLADRTALVKQALQAFQEHLPDLSLCNLCENKENRDARVVFSTYPTMLNAIDSARDGFGVPFFTPAHFDLIILDESHRSIFKKYRTIFRHFDAIMVGLTATPKTDVDHNVYDFFDLEQDVPTYSYDYETAVEKDHVLVPYYTYEVTTQFLEEGIVYDDLPEEEKEKYREDFMEDDFVPDFIPSENLNKFIFATSTVDIVLQDLMERGIKVQGGDRLGKTIIFAQNKNHAEFIIQRFDALYPEYKGHFARKITCEDAYAQTVLDSFKVPEKEPHIAVSVDMMDTGIDVPECVNLVFFKKVRSKAKFWQMIGRGTRLCPDLICQDHVVGEEYVGKRHFLIFDYCGNFTFFSQIPNGVSSKSAASLSERIFGKQIQMIANLQQPPYAADDLQTWRGELVEQCSGLIQKLNRDRAEVHLQLQYVNKFKQEGALQKLSDLDQDELLTYIAPIIHLMGGEELAKRFDNMLYGIMLGMMTGASYVQQAIQSVCRLCARLEKKAAVPQVAEKLPLIQLVQTEEFWASGNLLEVERARKELRDLIKFLDNDKKALITTDLVDVVIDNRLLPSGFVPPAFDPEAYRKAVEAYVLEHRYVTSIHKLMHNLPLTPADYGELERILTQELGSREQYNKAFEGQEFGLVIRKITKLDHDAAMEAFAEFINDASLNSQQIDFVKKIIAHVEMNGYMEDPSQLNTSPEFQGMNIFQLFDRKTTFALIGALTQVKQNAQKPEGVA